MTAKKSASKRRVRLACSAVESVGKVRFTLHDPEACAQFVAGESYDVDFDVEPARLGDELEPVVEGEAKETP